MAREQREGRANRAALAALQISVIPTTSSQQENPAPPSEKSEGPQQAPPRHNAKRPWPFKGYLFRGHLALIDAREQWKEVGILIMLILVRIQMLSYVDSLNSTAADKSHSFKLTLKTLALQQRSITAGTSLFIIGLLLLAVLLRRRIPRRWLDMGAGAFISFNRIFHCLKINLLLLHTTGVAPAADGPAPHHSGVICAGLGVDLLAHRPGGPVKAWQGD